MHGGTLIPSCNLLEQVRRRAARSRSKTIAIDWFAETYHMPDKKFPVRKSAGPCKARKDSRRHHEIPNTTSVCLRDRIYSVSFDVSSRGQSSTVMLGRL